MNPLEKHHLLEALFEHATESIIVTNPKGEIQVINPATQKLFNYVSSELEGKTIECLIPSRIAERHVAYRESYNHNPHPRSMGEGRDLFARKKDGSEFPVEISLTPFEFHNQQYIIAFIIDISLRKKAELEIQRKQEELIAMTNELKVINEKLESKVEARTKVLREALFELEKSKQELSEAFEKEKELNELKSRFLSMASHEFRTPLTTVLSSASIIEDYEKEAPHEKRAKHLHRIKNAVHNLNDILSDFLSISKIEEGKVFAEKSIIDIKLLGAEVCLDLKDLTKPNQHIEFIHQGFEEILSDKKLLRNIMINLLSNAIKFSGEGSLVKMDIQCDSEFTLIKVIDEGIGISEEDKKHLFERFFRSSNALNIQGTGLGLHIVANYVELLNGKINLHSELEKGTTIEVIIPVLTEV
ncbi:MAG: PAS domain S-box protein [Bacteroidetes bacterium]|nr:PAS domain S-box protein [Bacteroidota bacterium]